MSKAAVLFVGNQLLQDDGIGPACAQLFRESFLIGEGVELFEVGCLTADMLNYLQDYDLVVTVDALDGTRLKPGTVFKHAPEDMARLQGTALSLHDLKLADLFDMAQLVDIQCQGVCFGMQAGNVEPDEFTIGLTDACMQNLPLLADSVAQELAERGFAISRKQVCNGS